MTATSFLLTMSLGWLELFDRTGLDDLDALNHLARVRAILRMGRSGGNFFQHVVAFDQFAEGGAL